MSRKVTRVGALLVLDIILINISVLMAYLIRFDLNYEKIPDYFTNNIIKILIIATIVKITCFISFKLYSSLWRYAGIYEMFTVVTATFIGNTIIMLYILFSKIFISSNTFFNIMAPRSIFIIAFLIDLLLIGGVRFVYRVFRRVVRGEIVRVKDSKRVLVVGGGDSGALVVNELKNRRMLKSTPVAIVDDDVNKIGRKLNGVPIIGYTKDIIDIIYKEKIDEIIIAMPSTSNKIISEIYNQCSKTNCKVKILPAYSQLIDESVIIQKIRDVDIEDLLGREPINLDIEEISSYLKDNVVLVTGGGGSIGSEICRQITSFNPKQLIILDNYENNAYDIQNELLYKNKNLNLITVIANIREKHRLDSIFKKYKPDVVFHAAAHKHVPLMEANPAEAVKNNVFGTMNVVDCADKYGVKKFVLISTDKAVNPTNIMGATKRIAEMIIQATNIHSKTEFVAVRFGNVLGSSGLAIPLFKKQIEKGGPVTVTHPDVTRFFMTIPEAVQLVIQAGAMAKGGEIFVLDMGQPIKISDLAQNLIKLSGFEPNEDIKIEYVGLRPGEKLYEEPLLAGEGLKKTKNNRIYVAKPVFTDIALLKREIETLKEIVMKNSEEINEYIKLVVPTYKKNTT